MCNAYDSSTVRAYDSSTDEFIAACQKQDRLVAALIEQGVLVRPGMCCAKHAGPFIVTDAFVEEFGKRDVFLGTAMDSRKGMEEIDVPDVYENRPDDKPS